MQQVLFFIPVRAIADSLPDLPWLVYVALGVLAIGVGGWLDRQRSEAARAPRHGFRIGGMLLGVLLILAGIAVAVAPNRESVPIYGYGSMLFVAFVACVWLASYLAMKDGIDPAHVQDMAIWIFLFGIIGARLTYMMFAAEPGQFTWIMPTILLQFFQVWDGGLVFYGSAVGGLVGYALAYQFVLKRHGISTWRMADIVAPCIALGLALGRTGCLLNGCCYGDVAVCSTCPGISFPLSSPPRYAMTGRGHQTAAGFLVEEKQVTHVERGSPAEQAGLKRGDVILQVNRNTIGVHGDLERGDLNAHLHDRFDKEYRGKNELHLRVQRASGGMEDLTFRPRTIAVQPTQLYESISMLFCFALLLAYYPLRSQPGAVMVLLIFCYGAHRFINEMLRTDNKPAVFGLTLSQSISLLMIGLGIVLALWLRIKSIRGDSSAPPPVPAVMSSTAGQ